MCQKRFPLSLSFHTTSLISQLLNTLLFFLRTHCATQFISATHLYSKGSVRGGGDSRHAEVWMGGNKLSAIVSHQSTPWGFKRKGKGRERERNVSSCAFELPWILESPCAKADAALHSALCQPQRTQTCTCANISSPSSIPHSLFVSLCLTSFCKASFSTTRK